jgi:hypothetical protein
MDKTRTRRNVLRWTAIAAATVTLSACHGHLHVPPGQIKKHMTPAATGTAPGQAKKPK